MARWGMIIDLRKCVGCKTCQKVCWEMNSAPPGASWRKVFDRVIRGNPNLIRIYLPINCMHCEEPSCLTVCPTAATYQRPDGIVDIKEEFCIGCGACIVACPYQVRTISYQDKIHLESSADVQMKSMPEQDRIGLCSKCHFCLPRVEAGLAKGLNPGSDPEASPLCVNFCIANALFFGDLDDPKSAVSCLIRENKTDRLQERLRTKPSIYYIMC